MINLLPPSAFKATVREYRYRVLAVWLYLLGTATLIGTVTLVPPYLLVGAQINVLETSVTSASDKVAQYDDAAKQLTETTDRAELLRSNAPANFTAYKETIEGLVEAGVTVSALTFIRNGTSSVTVAVKGEASNRQTLAGFRDRLESDPSFARVDLPVSHLIKDADIPFSLQITVDLTAKPTL